MQTVSDWYKEQLKISNQEFIEWLLAIKERNKYGHRGTRRRDRTLGNDVKGR